MVTLSLKDTAKAVAESHHKMDEGTQIGRAHV